MLDLKAVTHEDFTACLNQPFTIDDETIGAVEIELVEVERRGAFDPETQPRAPFSILFLGQPSTLR